MTFIASHNGKVYDRDLGLSSAKLAPSIKSFDPGKGWSVVKPECLLNLTQRNGVTPCVFRYLLPPSLPPLC